MYWENTSFVWTFLCHCHFESRSISSKCHKSVNLNTGNQVITKFEVHSKQTIRKKPRRFFVMARCILTCHVDKIQVMHTNKSLFLVHIAFG